MKKISGEICGAGHVVDSVNYIKIIWFSLIVSLPGLDLPSPDYLQAETVNRKGIILYDDCEDFPNSTNDWIVAEQGNSLTVSSERYRAGSKSYKFILSPKGTPGAQTNVELILRGLDAPIATPLRNFKYGVEYWIGYSVYIPSDFRIPTPAEGWASLSQFHGATEACDNQLANPCVAFFASPVNNGFKFNILATSVACTADNPQAERSAGYYSPAFTNGAWHDVVLNFKFNYVNEGSPFFKMWLNGQLVGTGDSGANCYNDAKGPYLKMGIYANIPYYMTVYYDEIRVGGPTSDYASVAPGTSSTPPPSAPRGLTVK